MYAFPSSSSCGFALLVANLTALTRSRTVLSGSSSVGSGSSSVGSKSSRLSLTPEAIIEFENMKAILASPAVLQQFQYGRRTIVYTDALVGTQDGMIAGGLGVVVVGTRSRNWFANPKNALSSVTD
ncbi:hypothetical protein BGX38DRAFT_66630 [Terfezia claveryi]|nr:hypothetical protein BGX38DRAFT_66630 [Terfezia claveryi]